jgi:hypothetical protein
MAEVVLMAKGGTIGHGEACHLCRMVESVVESVAATSLR